ncbi:MAG TPA: HEAT repeat domain-containing protein [Thermoanaerobaculia bacterium]|nr:HEAT repeat domain-containing protein [Thermoanaerobaculia bacterium]
MKESMPLLLTESLDPARRELSHQHIETCDVCGAEYAAYKETWATLALLPEVEVPARAKQRFLQAAGLLDNVNVGKPVETPAEKPVDNVVPFTRRPAFKWVAQAAAVVVLVGGAYFAGDRNADRLTPQTATIDGVTPYRQVSTRAAQVQSLAETRVLDAEALDPVIQGRPNIANVQFVDSDASDDQIGVSFDVTSRWTVTGNPKDKSIVRLLAYMLENEESMTPRSSAMEWVRRTYSDPAHADPEIANALAKVLRNDTHEGVRIRAVDTLTTLPAAVSTQTREALIEALKNDPNPAVRLKAVEALTNMAQNGVQLDASVVETLRAKAAQDDENLYVRVKAAEALSNITPR